MINTFSIALILFFCLFLRLVIIETTIGNKKIIEYGIYGKIAFIDRLENIQDIKELK